MFDTIQSLRKANFASNEQGSPSSTSIASAFDEISNPNDETDESSSNNSTLMSDPHVTKPIQGDSSHDQHDDDTAKTIDSEEEQCRSNQPLTSNTSAILRDEETGEELVWYFSYGSNMNPAVFEAKRKIKCRDFVVCKVPGYVLTYAAAPVPYFEPAFCTCLKRSDLHPNDHDDRPDIHGVAFLITKQQYEHMLLTEGGWGYQEYRKHPLWNIGHYGEEEIECIPIQTEECGNDADLQSKRKSDQAPINKPFRALTLVGLFGACCKSYDCNASKRYCDLVNIGAKSSGLPQSYRDYLREKHPAYEPSQCAWLKLGKLLIFLVAFPAMILEIGTMKFCAAWNERKLEQEKTDDQPQEEKHQPAPRRSFQDCIRPPWIMMKVCFLYRIYVIEKLMCTLLFDWFKFPNGFRNCCSGTHNDTKKSR